MEERLEWSLRRQAVALFTGFGIPASVKRLNRRLFLSALQPII